MQQFPTPVTLTARPVRRVRYFAYGPNMHPDQIRERCSSPTVLGPARLPGHALAFFGHTWIWDGGLETVVPAPGHDLWGVLYELGATDADSLDAWQDIRLNGTGSYFHSPVSVVIPDGVRLEAVLYKKDILGAPKPPSREFLEHIIEGARLNGLPARYLAELASLASAPARYPVPRRRDEDRDALRTTSCPDCTSLLDADGSLKPEVSEDGG